MTHYDFWFAPFNGEPFLCTIGQHEGSYRACLEAAVMTWEALAPFGNAQTRHPIPGPSPEDFRVRVGK